MLQSFNIRNLQDVEAFLLYVIEPNGLNLGMGFHPDNDFADYINENGATFTKEEAEQLNATLDLCFNLCEKQDTDLYEIALSIVQPIYDRATAK